MSDETHYKATSRSTAVLGRTITSARGNHFIIDSPSGPAEALSTGEAFMAGIAACGVTLIQARARDGGITLGGLDVTADGVRVASAPADLNRVDMRFEFRGTSQADAKHLVGLWQQQ
ncbi:MAG: hypothetical protein U0821_25440 [Chloroflexota bacterium]